MACESPRAGDTPMSTVACTKRRCNRTAHLGAGSTGSRVVPARPEVARPSTLLVCLGLALTASFGCGSAEFARIRAVGIAPYVPVPADALKVRRADAAAVSNLFDTVLGLRYARAGAEFSLAPSAFTEAVPSDARVVTRDVVGIGEPPVRMFWVVAQAGLEATYTDAQRAQLREGIRVDVQVRWQLDALGARTQEGLSRVLREGMQLGLRQLYASRSVPAHGRIFLLDVQPSWKPDPIRLPIDPGDRGVRPDEYRYRSGVGLLSTETTALVLDLVLWVLPDVRIA